MTDSASYLLFKTLLIASWEKFLKEKSFIVWNFISPHFVHDDIGMQKWIGHQPSLQRVSRSGSWELLMYSSSTKHNINGFETNIENSAMEVQGKTILLAEGLGKAVASHNIFIQTSILMIDQDGCIFMWIYISCLNSFSLTQHSHFLIHKSNPLYSHCSIWTKPYYNWNNLFAR